MHRSFVILALAVALGVAGLLISSASALPRFASRTGARCQSCHVNPSGGMMRQAFGVQYGRDRLPVEEWNADSDGADLSNLIGSFLGVGADLRTLYFTRQMPDSGNGAAARNRNGFFQMQGDLYLNFRLSKRISLFLNKGLYSGFEAFGLLNVMPAHGYLKAGKFLPNFGTRLDDHTTFIRTYTGFSPEQGRRELTGAEVGIAPGALTVTGGIYNASDGFGAAVEAGKAFLGRVDALIALGEESHMILGANVFTRDLGGRQATIYGGMGSLSFGDLTILGEADLTHGMSGLAGLPDPFTGALNRASGVKGLVSYVEADYMVVQGVDLKLSYDFYDPDLDEKSGSLARYSAGLEFFPWPGVELRPIYRINHETPTNVKNNEFDLLLHLYF